MDTLNFNLVRAKYLTKVPSGEFDTVSNIETSRELLDYLCEKHGPRNAIEVLYITMDALLTDWINAARPSWLND